MQDSLQCAFTQALDDAFDRNQDRIAAVSPATRDSGLSELSYRAIDKAAARLQTDLHALGIQADEPVLVFTSNLPSDLQSFLGVWRAGAVAVPVHRESVYESIKAIQSRVRSRFIIVGTEMPAAALPPGEQLMSGLTVIHVLQAEAPIKREALRDAALVMFTSGSTGEPKGVVLSRRSFLAKLRAINQILNFQPGLRSLLVLQLNFAFGQWVSILTLLQGGTLVISPKFVALDCLRNLVEQRINQIAVVPTMLRAMLSEFRGAEGEHWLVELQNSGCPELLCTGGEPLAEPLGQKFRELLPHTGIADVFGLTETCTSDFILPPALFDRYAGSIGFATPGVQFRIVDPATGRVIDGGEAGELEIKTDYIMSGYLEAPELTAAQFHDGYFKTGDLAWRGEHGEVRLAGRSKDLILRGGNKISPIEIDAMMVRHPDVDASLSVGVPDSLMGERIHTVIVLRNDASLNSEQLRNWAAQRLDKFKVPDRVHFTHSLPQGRTGKDDRRALLRWLDENGLLEDKT